MGGIVLESVRKHLPGGVVVVNDMDLELREGELVAFVGPSGCGKTTTLRMVAGLEDITAGAVRSPAPSRPADARRQSWPRARSSASTSIDPNWDPTERWDGGLRALLRLTDVFLPNRAEATSIARKRDPGSAARSLAEHAGLAAVKLGAEGALAADRDGRLTEVAPLLDLEALGEPA